MTDLQLGLLLVGAGVVVAVVVYNQLQERAARRAAERVFAARHPDALLADEPARKEPTLEAAPVATEPKADYVIELEGLDAEALRMQWAPIERRFGERAMLRAAGPSASHAVLQLVSRKGVVGEAQLIEFRTQLETLAASHGAAARAPEMRRALEAAASFDRACADLDIQVALHVVGIPPPELEAEHPFTVAPRPDGVTLLLDVPRTAEVMRSYEAMVRTARELAARHGGRLADDNGKPLDEPALAAIASELESVCARLEALGVKPGGALALRIFS